MGVLRFSEVRRVLRRAGRLDLGTLRASFHCIVRPTVAGCGMLLLALLLIGCLQPNEYLRSLSPSDILIQGFSFATEVTSNGAVMSSVKSGKLEDQVGLTGSHGLQNLSTADFKGEPNDNAERKEDRVVEDLSTSAGGGASEFVQTGAPQNEESLRDRKESISEDVSGGSELPWLDQAVPYQWEECSREGHELGKAVCVYGPGARGAKVMQPTYFFLDVFNWKDNCYARMTGPAIFVVKMKFEGLHVLRGSYTAHEPGEYQLWISCKTSHANGTVRTLPPNSKIVPWHHHELISGSPFPITVLPNPTVRARGCQPCTGPDTGTLGGQWVSRAVLAGQCGGEALGAVEEWHEDEHVWVPRQCTLPFFSRDEFARRFAGADLLLMGDSTVRGTFCDLQNWLHFRNGPSFFSGPYEMYEDGSSSWDYRTCGYNDLQPVSKNFAVVEPNPFTFADVRIRYFEAREPETLATAQAEVWKHVEAHPERPYRAVLANFGLWWWHRYSPVCAPSSLIRLLLDHLRCKRDDPMPVPLEEGIDPFDCDWRSALRNLGLPVTWEGYNASVGGDWVVKDVVKAPCVEPFPGRVVYRSITGKFDDHNMCTEGYKHVFDVGEVCAQKLETDRMLLESFSDTASWERNPLLMDVFDMVYARPDRSLDSYHFFSHKCIEKPCGSLTWDYERCCYEGNVVPWTGSMSMTNLWLHQLASDPLLANRHQTPTE